MQLVGFSSNGNRVHFVRDLTEEEIAKDKKYTAIFTEARGRFHLFKILSLNYAEWTANINLLLNPQSKNHDSEILQLDRLLLNYLSCAYTIHEHFKTSLRRRFRNTPEKLKAYDDFVGKLCEKSWEFAFLLDFRGYVQHCGLGVGQFNRQATLTSVTLSIGCDAAQLAANSREWKRSKLTGKEGSIELAPIVQEFHHRMLESYGGYAAKLFYPDLFPAAQFYLELTNEVKKHGPDFRMFF
ncbi:MAG TPA: hypothetical protein VIK62_01955, partial [Verrucomicrobiae bacterium]